jgi:hypothetical protein
MRSCRLIQPKRPHRRRAGVAVAVVAAAAAAPGGMRGSEATPIVVDGIMYMPTPYNRVIALEAHTGKEVWVYKSPGAVTNRGVEYWPGDGTAPPMILFVSGGLLVGSMRAPASLCRRLATTARWISARGSPTVSTPGRSACRRRRRSIRTSSSPARACRNRPRTGYAGDTARLGLADRQTRLAVPPRAAAGRSRS